MLICLQRDRLAPARGVPLSTVLAHMAQAKLYRSCGLITDELIKPGTASLAVPPALGGAPATPQVNQPAWSFSCLQLVLGAQIRF